jgi:hypothetical protein
MDFLNNLKDLAGLGDTAKNMASNANLDGVTDAIGSVTGGVMNVDIMSKLMEMVTQFKANPNLLSALGDQNTMQTVIDQFKGFIPSDMAGQALSMVGNLPGVPDNIKSGLTTLLQGLNMGGAESAVSNMPENPVE